MPSRNIEKIFIPEAYYHVYNRGVEKRAIFLDDEDYCVFLNLLKRYLDDKPSTDRTGRQYEWLHDQLELLAFCLMPNHFHLFIYQINEQAITKLMKNLCTSYVMYFNKKYKRVGPLFQGRYKAKDILDDAYFQHISRYIHLNPTEFETWKYSSLPYFLNKKNSKWVQPGRVLEAFEGESYIEFVKDYIGQKEIMDELKHNLADK